VYSGRADIGLLGREIWPTEVAAFTATAGHAPKVIEVATGSFDVPKATFALMVFVPKDNPVASLSMAQLARIFSTRDTVKTWGELGLKGAWAGRPIHRYGFAIDNDKSQIFAQLVFAKGAHWSGDLREFANGSDGTDAGELILRALANDPDGIALSNVHYATSAVRALPLSTAAHPQPIAPTRDNVASTLYPLTRAVYMVLDDAPSAATVEFMRFVLSRDGAQAVEREGEYLPLTKGNAASQMERLAAR
jgi:phosphate transport system substrate-binding protein